MILKQGFYCECLSSRKKLIKVLVYVVNVFVHNGETDLPGREVFILLLSYKYATRGLGPHIAFTSGSGTMSSSDIVITSRTSVRLSFHVRYEQYVST